jgi:hypothetical protein
MKIIVSSSVTISPYLFSIQMETHLSQQGSSGTSPSTLFSRSLPPSCYYVTGTCCIHRFLFRALLFFFTTACRKYRKNFTEALCICNSPPPSPAVNEKFYACKMFSLLLR